MRLYDMSLFGLPQKRIRCIAGKYPAEILDSYIEICTSRTLGFVLHSLATKPRSTCRAFKQRFADVSQRRTVAGRH